MGRWGDNLFDDDAMLDSIELYKFDDPVSLIPSFVNQVSNNADFIDYDLGADALVGILMYLSSKGAKVELPESLDDYDFSGIGKLKFSTDTLATAIRKIFDEDISELAMGLYEDDKEDILMLISSIG